MGYLKSGGFSSLLTLPWESVGVLVLPTHKVYQVLCISTTQRPGNSLPAQLAGDPSYQSTTDLESVRTLSFYSNIDHPVLHYVQW